MKQNIGLSFCMKQVVLKKRLRSQFKMIAARYAEC